jgi:hypothetical protein
MNRDRTRSSLPIVAARFLVACFLVACSGVALEACGSSIAQSHHTTAPGLTPAAPATTAVPAPTTAPATTTDPAPAPTPAAAAPATTTVPPPGGLPAGNPWPTRVAIAPGHHAVLVMGDSLAGQTYWSLPTILAFQGIDATAYDATMPTAGLLDPMFGLDPPAYLASQLDAHPDVDTVVFEFAGACASACATGGVEYGSADFYTRWQAVAHQLMSDAKARGLHVIWAISPPPPVPDDPNDTHFVRATQVADSLIELDRRYPATEGVVAADWYAALADTAGMWQPGLWYDGVAHLVRADDLVHLTPDGSVRTSTWTIAALAEAWE